MFNLSNNTTTSSNTSNINDNTFSLNNSFLSPKIYDEQNRNNINSTKSSNLLLAPKQLNRSLVLDFNSSNNNENVFLDYSNALNDMMSSNEDNNEYDGSFSYNSNELAFISDFSNSNSNNISNNNSLSNNQISLNLDIENNINNINIINFEVVSSNPILLCSLFIENPYPFRVMKEGFWTSNLNNKQSGIKLLISDENSNYSRIR